MTVNRRAGPGPSPRPRCRVRLMPGGCGGVPGRRTTPSVKLGELGTHPYPHTPTSPDAGRVPSLSPRSPVIGARFGGGRTGSRCAPLDGSPDAFPRGWVGSGALVQRLAMSTPGCGPGSTWHQGTIDAAGTRVPLPLWPMGTGFLAGLTIGLVVVTVAVGACLLVVRRRHGGLPLPAWVLTSKNASPALRSLVARMARSELRDVLQEWDEMPPGLRVVLRREIRGEILAILKRGEQR